MARGCKSSLMALYASALACVDTITLLFLCSLPYTLAGFDKVSLLLVIWQVNSYLEQAHRAWVATPVGIRVLFVPSHFALVSSLGCRAI